MTGVAGDSRRNDVSRVGFEAVRAFAATAAMQCHVLAPEALDVILGNGLDGLAGTQVDALAGERERLANVVAELDRKIRLTAVHAINGMIDESDAKAITAPLIALTPPG